MKWDALRLFGPLASNALQAGLPESDVLHVSPRPADYYATLFCVDQFKRLLWEQGPQMAELAYAHRDGHTVYPPQTVLADLMYWLEKQYHHGATVVVNSVSRHHVPVARLCGALEEWLDARVVANAYWAPPGAPGYAAHFDTDDTVFLQIAGSKRWHIHAPHIELPLRMQLEAVDPACLGAAREIELRAGEVLYLPRGMIHTPVAGNQGSLHLTLGIRHVLVFDVLAETLRAFAEGDVRLHERANPEDLTMLRALIDAWIPGVEEAAPRMRARLRAQWQGKPLPEWVGGGDVPRGENEA